MCARALDALVPDDFGDERTRLVFEVLRELRDGDPVRVMQRARERWSGDPSEVGPYIHEVIHNLAHPNPALVDDLIRLRRRRGLLDCAEYLTKAAEARDEDIEDITALARAMVLAPELSNSRQARRILTRDDLMALPDPEYLLEPWLLRETFAQLSGSSGSFKSFLALDWSAELGRRGRRVLYVVGEGGAGVKGRIHAWETKHRERMRVEFTTTPLDLFDGLEEELSAISEPRDLIVLDTLARHMRGGRNENATPDMTAFVGACDRLRETTGGAVLVVHHFGWEQDRQRGSTALYAACDTVIYTERKGDVVEVWADKQKDTAERERVRFRWVPVDLTRSGVLIPTVKDVADETDPELMDRVLEHLVLHDGASKTAIRESLGKRYTDVSQAIDAAVRKGYIRLETVGRRRGEYHYLTEAGRRGRNGQT